MKRNMHTRGFTLIELLVVIAIIGILASVVLASLNSARSKGADSAIASNLNNARAQAELFYYNQTPPSYTNVCATAGGIGPMLAGASEAAGGDAYVDCDSNATAWAMRARSVSNTGQYYCTDSTGAAKVITDAYNDGLTVTVCP